MLANANPLRFLAANYRETPSDFQFIGRPRGDVWADRLFQGAPSTYLPRQKQDADESHQIAAHHACGAWISLRLSLAGPPRSDLAGTVK